MTVIVIAHTGARVSERARIGGQQAQVPWSNGSHHRSYPHRGARRAAASSMMETSGALTFAADGQDTLMSWDWQVRPKGWLRMLGPLSGPLGSRMERRIWTGLKHQLEGDASAHPA